MRSIKIILLVQGIATLATFLLIMVAPTTIPSLFDLVVPPENYVLLYLIGVNEAALSFLSFAAFSVKENSTLKTVSAFFLLFHFTTAMMCIVGIAHGTSIKIIGNTVFRMLMAILFYYYGIHQINKQTTQL